MICRTIPIPVHLGHNSLVADNQEKNRWVEDIVRMGNSAESPVSQKHNAYEWVVLMRAIVERNEEALAQLYDLTVDRVYGLAHAITRNKADAEEVVTDVYLQIWQRANQYSESRGTVLAWLMVNCRSLALDLLRRRRSQERGQERLAAQPFQDQADCSAEEMLSVVQEGTLVHHALNALSEVQRQLIALAYFRDMSHQEIASATQLPLGTVKSHIRRGLKTLRSILEQ